MLKPVLAKFATEEEFLAMPSAERNLFEMVKLQVSDKFVMGWVRNKDPPGIRLLG